MDCFLLFDREGVLFINKIFFMQKVKISAEEKFSVTHTEFC